MKELLDDLIQRYPALSGSRNDIWNAAQILVDSYALGGKLLIAGNGGSAADAEHIVGEMMKSFVLPRALPEGYAEALTACDPELGAVLRDNLQGALPAIALDGHVALSTAYLNDCEPLLGFAQQVGGYGRPGKSILRGAPRPIPLRLRHRLHALPRAHRSVLSGCRTKSHRIHSIPSLDLFTTKKQRNREVCVRFFACLCILCAFNTAAENRYSRINRIACPVQSVRSALLAESVRCIIRYTVMSRTQPTVIKPSMRNMPCTIFSNNLFFFIINLNGNKRRHLCPSLKLP